MLLQFIVPYYGSADILVNSLGTLFKQKNNTDTGLIVINDNGDIPELTAETAKVKQFLEMMKSMSNIPIVYIENEKNSGPGVSRNNGLAASSAEYISFLDSDDYLHEEFVSLFKQELEKDRSFDIFVGSCIAIKSETEYMVIPPEVITWLHSKVYKRSFLMENDIYFPGLRMNEDSGFNAIAYEVTKAITYYKGDIPMYYWMQNNPNSLTTLSNSKPYAGAIRTYLESVIYAYEKVLRVCEPETLDRFPAQILQTYLFYCELLYRGEDVSGVEVQLQNFFDLIHSTQWYKSQRIKEKIAQYVISQNILGPMIPEITFASFVKKFEKESLNFR